MPGAQVEAVGIGTAHCSHPGPRQDHRAASSALLVLCLQPVSGSPRPSDVHATLDMCCTPTLHPAWSKEQQGEVRRRERKNPAHMTPCERGDAHRHLWIEAALTCWAVHTQSPVGGAGVGGSQKGGSCWL